MPKEKRFLEKFLWVCYTIWCLFWFGFSVLCVVALFVTGDVWHILGAGVSFIIFLSSLGLDSL